MNWEADPFARILHCGIDLDQFQEPLYDDSLRGELGLKSDVTVIGHVGRFAEAKNHTFLIDIMAELIELDPNTHLVLVGDGPLRHRIQQRVADLELSSNVHFVGLRSDVAKVMLSTFDVFVLPSLHEGLPVVAVEAQAAGLPCVLSDTVAPEATVVPALVTRLSLNMSSRDWANTVLDSVRTPTGVQRSEALQRVQNSPFNIVANVAALSALYSQHATPSLRS